MRSITVRDDFSSIRDFTEHLPTTFDREGLIIHNSRNVIKKIDTKHGTFVVKNFAGMYFFNRLAYSLFRKSKAVRSYEYSAILNQKGIMTPPHVAWLDCYSMGLLTRSYFVSVFNPNRTLEQMIQQFNAESPSRKTGLIRSLAQFIRELHLKEIYHEDLSIGNILVIPTANGYSFALVDLNRIKFRPVSFRNALRNFTTLLLSVDDMNKLIAEYSSLAGEDNMKARRLFWRYKNRKAMLRRWRRTLRKYTLTQIEKIFKPHH